MTKKMKPKPAKPPAPSRPRAQAAAPGVDPRFAPLVAAFAGEKDVSVGRRFSTTSALSVKGKIFAMVVKGKLVIKLPRERVDELVDAGLGTRFDPRNDGRLMKEWFVAAGATKWKELAREAHRFVKSA